MPTEPDLDIPGYSNWGLVPIVSGIAFIGVGLYYLFNLSELAGPVAESVGGVVAIILIGTGLVVWGRKWMRDTAAKLSLTAEGLRDHRTGVFIKWIDCHGVRLHIEDIGGYWTTAAMYVTVRRGGQYREVAFDVDCLDYPPTEIAELAQKRSLAALNE